MHPHWLNKQKVLRFAACFEHRCDIEVVQAYAHKFKLPKNRNRGKVSDLFFKDSLVMTDHVRHFAGDVLGMINIMFALLVDRIKPRGWALKHIECFESLYIAICILRRGSMCPATHTILEKTLLKHNTLFLELYGEKNCKIKFHHIYHIAKDMLYMGGCISCFPGERKNKDALALSVASDKIIEKSATWSFLHRTVSHWHGNDNACLEYYLNDARRVSMQGEKLDVALSATLKCGIVHANDMVYLVDGSIGKVCQFWQSHGKEVTVKVLVHKKIPSSRIYFELEAYATCFLAQSCIVEPVGWYAGTSYIVACIPEFC